MSDIRFDGKVALITGAGGGLGKTYAKALAARGCKVVVNDLGGKSDGTGASASMADTVVKEIEQAGGMAVANHDSVATPEGGKGMVQAAIDNFGRIDIVINNAGILRDKSFAKLAPADLEIVLDVHLKGAFYVSQPAFRAMKERNYGRFVFTASAAGLFGLRPVRQLGTSQLRRGQDGPGRPFERARRRGREVEHQVERDRADRKDPPHRGPARTDGGQADARPRHAPHGLPVL